VGEKRVRIPPKAFDVLRYLVENPGRLVTQDELLEAVWPETYVNPEILRKYILDIRRILGDRPDKPVFHRNGHEAGIPVHRPGGGRHGGRASIFART